MKIFRIIWFGQLVSLLGTGMTRFALLIWAYERTEAATTVALLGFYIFLPIVIVSPIAGIVVDRFSRKWVMIVADVSAGVFTIFLYFLFRNGLLEVWHIFAALGIAGILEAFQGPAYTAASTLILPKEDYSRAMGMRSIAEYAGQIGAPIMAGLFFALVGLDGIMLIDIVTFLFATVTLFFITLPESKVDVEESVNSVSGWRNLLEQSKFGTRFIWERKGLLGLLTLFMGINFFAALTWFAVLPALILARTGGDEQILGLVQGALGLGGVVGGIILTYSGGPKKKIHGVLGFCALSFFLGDMSLAIGKSPVVWIVGAFVGAFFIPFIIGGQQAIWQSKVHPRFQGRVFAARQMWQMSSMPVAFLLAGYLADQVLGPRLVLGGSLVPFLGGLVGVGTGAGIGAMFFVTAILGALMGLFGYLIPVVRDVEKELPDHDFVPDAT